MKLPPKSRLFLIRPQKKKSLLRKPRQLKRLKKLKKLRTLNLLVLWLKISPLNNKKQLQTSPQLKRKQKKFKIKPPKQLPPRKELLKCKQSWTNSTQQKKPKENLWLLLPQSRRKRRRKLLRRKKRRRFRPRKP